MFRLKHTGSAFLIFILVLFTFLQTKGQNHSVKNNDSVVLVYYKQKHFEAVVHKYLGKKIMVKCIDNSLKKDFLKVRKQQVFTKRTNTHSHIAETLRFSILSDELADEVIKKGQVIGFNSTHYLMEYNDNGESKLISKHKSEIVKKDL